MKPPAAVRPAMTRSLWQDRAAASPGLARPLERDAAADVLIVGGGMTGVFAAFHAAGAGLQVALLERGELFAGASGRNVGFLMAAPEAHYANAVREHGRALARDVWAFNRATILGARALLERVGAGPLIERTGSAVAALDEKEAELLREDAELLRADGFPGRLVGREGAGEATGGVGFHGALLVDDDAQVDPVGALTCLARAAIARGARIFGGAEVASLVRERDGWVATTTRGIRVAAPSAIAGLNAYSPELLAFARERVRAVRGQVLATAPLPRRVPRPVYADHGYLYVRSAGDRVVAGGMRHTAIDAEVGTSDETTEGVQGAIASALAKHWPWAAAAHATHRWSGAMGFSRDGLPWIGEVPGAPGLLVAFGCTGHGWGYWPWAGEALAAIAAGGAPEIPRWCRADRPLD